MRGGGVDSGRAEGESGEEAGRREKKNGERIEGKEERGRGKDKVGRSHKEDGLARLIFNLITGDLLLIDKLVNSVRIFSRFRDSTKRS